MSAISRETLACYLDDALSAAETARVEAALRDSEPLRQMVLHLLQQHDSGDHSLGAIWRRARLSCPSREHLGSYLLGVLEPAFADYLQFHLEVIGCAYCQANLEDLQARPAAKAGRHQRYFESSVGMLKEK